MCAEFKPMRSLIYVDCVKEQYRVKLRHWLYAIHVPDSISHFEPYCTKYCFYPALPAPADPEKYGIESYDYKISTRGESSKPQIVIGYLSGTFDLFHIGHLNLLKRAKAMCDYLIVGVHKSGAWKGKETFIPFEERTEIVRNIKYVDQVIESFPEDSMAYDALHYDKLFVGSDYKGTERFNRYEEYFSDKGVEIVYFPYTQGTSSTKLRDAITKKK